MKKKVKSENKKKSKRKISIITVFLWIFLVATMITILTGNIKNTNALENKENSIENGYSFTNYSIGFVKIFSSVDGEECPIKSLETLPEGFSIKCTIINEEENFNKVYNFNKENLNYGIDNNGRFYVEADMNVKLTSNKVYDIIYEVYKISVDGYEVSHSRSSIKWTDNEHIYKDEVYVQWASETNYHYYVYEKIKPKPLDLYDKTLTMVCKNNQFHDLKPLVYKLAYSESAFWSEDYCKFSDTQYNGSNYECILTINTENWLNVINNYLKKNKNINFDHIFNSCDNKMKFIYDEESKTWISDKDEIIIYAEDPEGRYLYNVYYQWEGLPSTSNINIPHDNNMYMENDIVKIDKEYVNGTVISINNMDYIFSGWIIDDINILKENEFVMPNKDIIVSGIWREKNIKDEQKVVKVEKIWEDNNNENGKRPENVILQVKNKDKIVEEILVDENNNWSYEFLLPKYDENGEEIEYRVDEKETSKYYEKVIDGYRVINKYIEENEENSNDIINEENVNTSDINVSCYIALLFVSIISIILLRKNNKLVKK